MRRFELSDGKSNKFWQVDLVGDELDIAWGKIGTDGQRQLKSFASEGAAQKELEKLVKQKVGKGYVEVGAPEAPPAREVAAPAPVASSTTVTAAAPVSSATAMAPAAPPADLAALPGVLRDPPWRRETAVMSPPVVIDGLEPIAVPERIEWPPGEREEHLRVAPWSDHTRKESEAVLKEMARDAKTHPSALQSYIDSWWCTQRLFDDHLLEAWRTLPRGVWRTYNVPILLARLGEQILPDFVDFAGSLGFPTAAKALLPVVSTRVAPIMAEGLASKRGRADAERWLRTHREVAALGLIPQAVGAPGKARDLAGAALRFVARRDEDVVRKAALRYGAEAAAAIDEVLAFDEAQVFPKKLPKLPAFADPKRLTAPLLRSGGAIPPQATEALLTMLAFSPLEAPYAGIAHVRETCEPASLAAFAWELFSAWRDAGMPSKEDWAFTALGLIGDDESARRLAPLIRAWPGAGGHQRAVKGLDVLAAIGTDVALMNLHAISQKVKFKGLREKANEKVEAIAEARGLSVDELADRLVPSLDLDSDGSMTLDFGPRTFRVGFDESLKPFVRDGAGKRMGDLPKPGKSDDVKKAAGAIETWKALKKDVRALASGQVLRLELAMCTRRRWDAPSFRALIVDHPLVTHLAQSVVWATYEDGRPSAFFRVAEDRTFADERDEPFQLGADAVGIPHPLEMNDAVKVAFGEIFGDYEILQPFPQLGRPTFEVEPTEKEAKQIARFDGAKVPTRNVLGLLSRGWEKGPPQDAGGIWWFERPLPGRRERATLSLSPGFYAGGMVADAGPDQELGSVALPVTAGELHPVVFSELVADLERLRV